LKSSTTVQDCKKKLSEKISQLEYFYKKRYLEESKKCYVSDAFLPSIIYAVTALRAKIIQEETNMSPSEEKVYRHCVGLMYFYKHPYEIPCNKDIASYSISASLRLI